MNPLELRKQLLIAESELNRAQLAGEMAVLTTGVRTLTACAKSVGALASAATLLVAGVSVFRCSKRPELPPGSLPGCEPITTGAGVVSNLWRAVRARVYDHENHQPTGRD